MRRLVSSVSGGAGSSGSPVLDLAGKVVGMTYGGGAERVTATPTPASPVPHTYFVNPAHAFAVTVEDIVRVGRELGVMK